MITQLVKSLHLYSKDCMRVRPLLPVGAAAAGWYGPLASLSLQIASVASEHHGQNNGGPNQWIIRVEIAPRLLKIHLFLLVKSSRISAGDV